MKYNSSPHPVYQDFMRRLGLKYQLRILSFISILFITLLCAVFYGYQYRHALALYELMNPVKIQSFSDTVGFLSLQVEKQLVELKRYHFYITTLGIVLISLLMIIVVHYILSKNVYAPIARLRRSMKQILQNEFETYIRVSSPSELGIIEAGCAHLQNAYLKLVHEMNHHIEVATEDLQQSL